jgi:hypothetical protein
VTVPTTITNPPPTLAPTLPRPTGPDGLCPFVGLPCDSPLARNDPDPDCVCSNGTSLR